MPIKITRDNAWFVINSIIWIYYAAVFASLWTPPQISIAGYSFEVRIFLSSLFGIGWNRIIAGVKNVLTNYHPVDAIDAKRLNEQIKSLSTALNAMAGAGVSIFAFSQLAKDIRNPHWVEIMIALGAAFYVHTGARSLLGFLKDESAAAYEPVSPSVS